MNSFTTPAATQSEKTGTLRNPMHRLSNIVETLCISLLIIFTYTFIHELAHALIAKIFGAEILHFNVNILTGWPHISYRGHFSDAQTGLIALAGPALPLLLWFAILMASKPKSALWKQKFLVLLSISILAGIIPNIILPIAAEQGINASSEDIVKFAQAFQIKGYYISASAFMLLIAGILLMRRKLHIREAFLHSITYKKFYNLNKPYQWLSLMAIGGLFLLVLYNLVSGQVHTTRGQKIPFAYHTHFLFEPEERSLHEEIVYTLHVQENSFQHIWVNGSFPEPAWLVMESEERLPGLRSKQLRIIDNKTQIQGGYFGWELHPGVYHFKLSTPNANGYFELFLGSEPRTLDKQNMPDELLLQGIIPDPGPDYLLVVRQELQDVQDRLLYRFETQGEFEQFTIYLTTTQGQAEITMAGRPNDYLINTYQIYTLNRGLRLPEGTHDMLLTAKGCDGEVFVFRKQKPS